MTSAAGVAILISLPPTDALNIVEDNLRRVAHLGASRIKALEKMLRNSQRCGYGIHTGEIVSGVSAYSVAIPKADGSAFASLGMSGAAAALPTARADEFIARLRVEAKAIAGDSSWVHDTLA